MTKQRDTPNPSVSGESAADRKSYKRHLDQRLDEALEETFPASDPIAVTPRRNRNKRARAATKPAR